MIDDIDRIEGLVAQLEREAPEGPRRLAQQLLAAVLAFHRQGLRKMLQALPPERAEELASQDDLVASMLSLHDLNPLSLERRVEQALRAVRPFLASHRGDVELVSCQGGQVRLRLSGSCQGCPSSQETLRGTILQAIYALAPELEDVQVEGARPEPERVAPGPCLRVIS